MTSSDPTSRDLESLLDFHVAAGVDIALDETAHDHFAEGAAENAARSRPKPPPLPSSVEQRELTLGEKVPAQPATAAGPAKADNAMVTHAAALAAQAMTLDDLKAALAAFDGCALKATAKNLVFADGNPQAKLMLVGEAPGADEDRLGLPFVGRSGKLLDRMLAAIGLDRTSVYIANTVPWRPHANRTPSVQETAVCRPFLMRQIELANPDLLLCIGGQAAHALLESKEGIMRLRGRWFDFSAGRRQIKAMATLHPAYLLRQPSHKKLAWQDFKAVRDVLGATKV